MATIFVLIKQNQLTWIFRDIINRNVTKTACLSSPTTDQLRDRRQSGQVPVPKTALRRRTRCQFHQGFYNNYSPRFTWFGQVSRRGFSLSRRFYNDIKTQRHIQRVIEQRRNQKSRNGQGSTDWPLFEIKLTLPRQWVYLMLKPSPHCHPFFSRNKIFIIGFSVFLLFALNFVFILFVKAEDNNIKSPKLVIFVRFS